MSFEYQPLHTRQSTARLTLHSVELGYFHYDLSLTALPPPPEKIINFSTPLGRSQVELVKFINYSHLKTEYSCSVRTTFFLPLAMTNVIYIFDVPNIYNMNVFIMYSNAFRYHFFKYSSYPLKKVSNLVHTNASLAHSRSHSLMHSLTHSLACSFARSLIHLLCHQFPLICIGPS